MARPTQQQGKIKVLLVAANPVDAGWLMLGEEQRAIEKKIRASEHRDLLDIVPVPEARPDDLLQAFNMHKPQVVHFSGHGSSAGEIQLVGPDRRAKAASTEALKSLFSTFRGSTCVVLLNACYSLVQAKAITEVVDCAIGMSSAIDNNDAIVFAASFYRAIGFNRSIEEAFNQAVTALTFERVPKHEMPQLLCKPGVDPSRIFLVASVIEDRIASEAQRRLEQLHNEIQSRLKRVQEAVLYGSYDSAYQDINMMVRKFADNMSPQDLAKLKYLESLVHLDGKRPYVQSPSVMRNVEALLGAASRLHSLYSYKIILALFKLDFARSIPRNQDTEANGLMQEAMRLPRQAKDYENIEVLSTCQRAFFQDFGHYLHR